jgi:hypothetical protein
MQRTQEPAMHALTRPSPWLRVAVVGGALLAAGSAMTEAQAHPYGRGGGGWGHHGGRGWGGPVWGGIGLGVGIGLGSYYYGAPWYYGPPVYVVPAQVQGGVPVAATPAARPAPEPIVYPRNGQTAAQTENDRRDCERWATTQPNAMADATVFQRATTACLEGRGYTVR